MHFFHIFFIYLFYLFVRIPTCLLPRGKLQLFPFLFVYFYLFVCIFICLLPRASSCHVKHSQVSGRGLCMGGGGRSIRWEVKLGVVTSAQYSGHGVRSTASLYRATTHKPRIIPHCLDHTTTSPQTTLLYTTLPLPQQPLIFYHKRIAFLPSHHTTLTIPSGNVPTPHYHVPRVSVPCR